MSGIYIHIPFCIAKCGYCNFYSITDLSLKEHYLQALTKEIALRSTYLHNETVETLYFGGGTPSLLSPAEIETIINCIKQHFTVATDAEITLEANPNSLTKDYLQSLKSTCVNRLSIGIQSFHDDDLHVLGRIHTAKQAEDSLYLAQKYGFTNLSVDLMYGFPELTLEKWKQNLFNIKDISHISCYQLSLENNTPLYSYLQAEKYKSLSEDEIMQQYDFLIDFAKKNDFIHYETSNFCKKEYESRHNTSYWKREPYLGLGTGAHSFNGNSRQWNLPDLTTYITFFEHPLTLQQYIHLGKNKVFEKEILSVDMQFNEYIMTSLRTIWGCDLNYMKEKFGKKHIVYLQQQLKTLSPNYFCLTSNKLVLTEKGSLFADFIASQLFI